MKTLRTRTFLLVLTVAITAGGVGLFLVAPVRTIQAATCPFIDNDGNDANAAVGTYQLNTNFTVTAAATAYDCTTAAGITTFIVPSGVTLTLDGDPTTGQIAQVNFTNLTVNSGGIVSANIQGCVGDSGHGNNPDGSNVCINDGGLGTPAQQYSAGGGAGHAGFGGIGRPPNGTGGTPYGSATAPTLFGGSGAGGIGGSPVGGTGGGAIRISVSGTFTHNGSLTANGGNGASAGSDNGGGGAGGSIYVTTNVMDGSTGTFAATGGTGGSGSFGGGGGSAGRIAIEYQSGAFGFDSGDFTLTGGAGGTGSTTSGTAGAAGTAYIVDTQGTGPATDDDVKIFHGFTYTDTDYSVNSWTFDAAADNQHCQYGIASSATPSITTAVGMTFDGTLNCSTTIVSFTLTPSTGNFSTAANSSFTVVGSIIFSSTPTLTLGSGSFVISSGAITMTASSAFSMGSGVTITDNTTNTDININIPAGNNQTWTNVTINGATEGDLIIDDAIDITLTGTTAINANVQWTALTALTVDTNATMNANSKGCFGDADNGNGPNGSNVCVNNGGSGVAAVEYSGGGGGGYGGAGGLGRSPTGTGGGTYGSATSPTLFGSSGAGGLSGGTGGLGGGSIRVNASGTVTINGTISANGGAGISGGSDNGGGGSGGSVYFSVASINGTTGAFQAKGGAGAAGTFGGGGGGAGRIVITYTGGSFGFDASDFDMAAGAGGTGGTPGNAGAKGTAYIKNTATSRVDIFHGFTYPDTDFSETTWVTDTSATNQYCDVLIAGSATPSVTAQTLTFGGTMNCTQSITSFTLLASGGPATLTVSNSASFTANAAITLDGNTNVDIGSSVTIVGTKVNADVVLDIPTGDDQTWTNVNITTASEGSVLIDDTFSLTLAGTTTINADTQLTALSNLTINSTASITSNTRGCVGDSGHGNNPDGSNVCINNGGLGTPAQQYSAGGGGGHGGAGGMGRPPNGTGGTTYDSATVPVLYGGSGAGGIGGGIGGTGGGVVRLIISGTFTNNGTVVANAGNGTSGGSDNGGGGAGGSIYVTTGTYACATAPTWSASGGSGASGTFGGGGGGGGRISIEYGNDTCGAQPLSGLSAAGVVPGGAGGTGSSTTGVAGSTGSLNLTATNPAPIVTVVSHSPSSPFTTDPVTLSGTATDNAGIVKIEIFLDGTAPANLKHTCNIAPTTPATCSIGVGTLSGGSHTTTIRAYDAALQMGSGTETFSVGGSTTAGQMILGRSKVSVSTGFTLAFALSGTSTGTLTVTFPVQFTVTAAGSGGASSGCLSSFGFTSTTLTATKTSCSGTVTLGGATVTNPSSPGTYIITWTNDSGSGSVYITSDDQVGVSANVDPVLTFNVGSQASATACDGTFTGNGGTIALGVIATGTVTSSDAASVAHICTRVTTNGTLGANITVKSLNASLKSTSTPADAIPSSTTTLVAGTAGYGLCAGSAGGDSGKDTTTPVGATPTRSAPFNGASCTASGHDIGQLTTSAQNLWTLAAASQNAFFRLYIKAAISPTTPAHNDYSDTLTFVATGTY